MELETEQKVVTKLDAIAEEVRLRADALVRVDNDPMSLMNGIKTTVMGYLRTGNLTRAQAIDTASRLTAIIYVNESKM